MAYIGNRWVDSEIEQVLMGCASSKLDDSPAVALCRERCAFLDEAVRQRFAFAEAHVAYLHSLKSVGVSLDRFFNQDLDGSVHSPPSPVLNLPAQRKGDPHPPEPSGSPPEKIQHHLDSHSDSGSHLDFHSDDSDDEDGSGSESLHHHDVSSPVHQQNLPYGGYFPGYENLNLNLPGAGGGGFMNMNYMKSQTTPSVVYTQRPTSPETMHMGGFFGGSSSPPAPYGGGGGFSSLPAVASTSKAPPPPPSPPSSSAWDFLNPFESFEKFYPPYTPSRDSREVREEEGIPDLEDEDDEVVKEVHGDQKFVDSGRSSYSKPGVSEEDARVGNDAELQYRARPSVGMESEPVEYEVHVVDKKVVDAAEKSKDQGNAAGFKPRGGFKGDSEVVREIQVQFERASESGNELAKFLEVEEKMRVLHEKKSRKLKRLDERGAEAHKVDATRTLVKSLSTKIKIAIQVVDKISVKINNLRDEELWPQLNEFIQGCTKGFCRALNNWLMKCLLVPEETPDGIVPFSPGRIGAPPVFVICNQWWQSLDRISEKEVVDSMRDFASNVLQLWDRDKAEMRQRMLANKDERKIKSLDKEDQKIQKEIQALVKRMVLISTETTMACH
ncbi:hypothetical protein DH2020_036826 [Rehmannia glutinosa]|uniref:Uncharacterized protein n=1 Tax=Rehmannia glutinosa TaxID=99300 RepID=A0ABR0V4Q4_REHGL